MVKKTKKKTKKKKKMKIRIIKRNVEDWNFGQFPIIVLAFERYRQIDWFAVAK